IFRPNNDTLLAMKYTNDAPFPRCADGFGRTLENKFTTAIQLDSLSWFCGCIAGSPGMAYFPCDEPVIFSEFNLGKPTIAHNAEDWIELKNNTDNPINFSGYTLKDEKQDHVFQLTGLVLNPGEYALIVKDSALFAQRHPYVEGKTLFQLPFGISNNDALRLYDINGVLLQSVVFDTTNAWPQVPFNADFTFEYLEANTNQALASNWFQGCEGGSPGRAYSPCPVLPEGEFAWLYPNPSNGEITISIDNTITGNTGTRIGVYDLSGKLVYEQEFPVVVESVEPIKMDLGFLSASMYLIRVTKASQTVTLRLIKD
ncbi:MAG: lamin tail domain-containing protein, partial [Flavobacteriales bacterium]